MEKTENLTFSNKIMSHSCYLNLLSPNGMLELFTVKSFFLTKVFYRSLIIPLDFKPSKKNLKVKVYTQI